MATLPCYRYVCPDIAPVIPAVGPACRWPVADVIRAAAGAPSGAAPLVIVFGHIGAGNLHVNVLGPDPAGLLNPGVLFT